MSRFTAARKDYWTILLRKMAHHITHKAHLIKMLFKNSLYGIIILALAMVYYKGDNCYCREQPSSIVFWPSII